MDAGSTTTQVERPRRGDSRSAQGGTTRGTSVAKLWVQWHSPIEETPKGWPYPKIKKSKTETSKWLKKKSSELEGFQWQAGYGIFSVSQSKVKQTKRYIANQEEHHKRFSFHDEFRELCKRYGVSIDERYVWD